MLFIALFCTGAIRFIRTLLIFKIIIIIEVFETIALDLFEMSHNDSLDTRKNWEKDQV